MIKFDKSKLVKNLAQGNILAPFLEREFSTFDEAWTFDYTEKIGDEGWHPSGDCTPSITDLYAKATGAEREPISGSLRKSFMVGHFWHQLIQYIVLHKLHFCEPEAIERQGMKHWGELKKELWDPVKHTPHGLVKLDGHNRWGRPAPYHFVTGSGDMAPLVTPKWQGIVDIKTMSSHQFKLGTLPEWAAAKYTCQINIYMDLFDEEHGMILAVNKDAPHDFKEFTFQRDQALIDAIYRKWHYISQCLDEAVLPTEEDNEQYILPI